MAIKIVPDKVKPLFSLRISVVGPAAVQWGAIGARFDIVNEDYLDVRFIIFGVDEDGGSKRFCGEDRRAHSKSVWQCCLPVINQPRLPPCNEGKPLSTPRLTKQEDSLHKQGEPQCPVEGWIQHNHYLHISNYSCLPTFCFRRCINNHTWQLECQMWYNTSPDSWTSEGIPSA